MVRVWVWVGVGVGHLLAHSEGDLELLGQVGEAVERLYRVTRDDTVAVVMGAHLVQVELSDIALPVLDAVCLW